MAIGLSVLGQRLLPADLGNLLSTIILASSVLYEFVGPTCAKASLFLSHSIEWDKKKRSEEEIIDEETRANLEQLVAESNREYQESLELNLQSEGINIPHEEDAAGVRLNNKRNRKRE